MNTVSIDFRSTYRVRWSSTDSITGTYDTGVARNSAGVVEINNGTAGTLRDLMARIVYADSLTCASANNTNFALSSGGVTASIHNASGAFLVKVTGGADLFKIDGAGFIEMSEITAPAAPAANKGRLYFEDNGAGKTRLMALFATGSAVQLGIEP